MMSEPRQPDGGDIHIMEPGCLVLGVLLLLLFAVVEWVLSAVLHWCLSALEAAG